MSTTATTTARTTPVSSPIETRPVVSRRPSGWKFALHTIPNLMVFALLGGVMYFGHHRGWKVPKFSELMGTTTIAADDWCTDHLVPASQCIECQVDLLPKGTSFGFCREHGVAECVIHHPELAQINGDQQRPQYDTVQAIALVPRPENNSRNTLHTRRVQFASAESVAKAGIDVDVVQERAMADAIMAHGELLFDPTRIAHLSTKVPGTVAAVNKTVGETVAAGEILALIDAAQVGQAKSQLLQAIVQLQLKKSTVERLQPIASSGAVPQKSLLEAVAALQEAEVTLLTARQTLANLGFDLPERLEWATPAAVADELRFLGVPESARNLLPAGTTTANLIPLRAPHDGVLLVAEVVAGEFVDASQTVFTVCDPRRMWLMLNVRQEDAKYVQHQMPVQFRPDGDDRQVSGRVAWISPAIDERTRTLPVRVAVSNEEGRLRDRTFGTGRILLREEPRAIVVPREAVQSTNDAHFVFVRDKTYFDQNSPKFFHVRQVRIGAQDDQYVELLAGVLPGEVVATQGSNTLLAQLLRSSLGAGCGCHEQ